MKKENKFYRKKINIAENFTVKGWLFSTYGLVTTALILMTGVVVVSNSIKSLITIHGNSKIINSHLNIVFDNPVVTHSDGAETSVSLENNKKQINFKVNLKYPGAHSDIKIDIFNRGKMAAKLDKIYIYTNNPDIKATYKPETMVGSVINVGLKKTITIKIEYSREASTMRIKDEPLEMELRYVQVN